MNLDERAFDELASSGVPKHSCDLCSVLHCMGRRQPCSDCLRGEKMTNHGHSEWSLAAVLIVLIVSMASCTAYVRGVAIEAEANRQVQHD